jgi:hypothetical protein
METAICLETVLHFDTVMTISLMSVHPWRGVIIILCCAVDIKGFLTRDREEERERERGVVYGRQEMCEGLGENMARWDHLKE